MRRTSLIAGLAALAAAAASPAAANPKFLEPYFDIFGARTILAAQGDTRPKDALQGQMSEKENPTRRWAVGFQGFNADGGADTTRLGGGLTYADAGSARHPWQASFNAWHQNNAGAADFSGYDFVAKYVLLTPQNEHAPVVSVVARYVGFSDSTNRWDALLAADQKITRDVYFTANVGWGKLTVPGFGDDLVAGLGANWRACSQLSFFINYVIDNDVDGEDTWAAGGTWAVNQRFSMHFGGGKHQLFFGSIAAKFDR